MIEAIGVYSNMVALCEQRSTIRFEHARKEREMLDAMTPEERTAYWEERKVRAIEANTNAIRDAAYASGRAASETEMTRLRGGGPGFGMGAVLGAIIGNGSE